MKDKASQIYSESKQVPVKDAGGDIVTKYTVEGVATAFYQRNSYGGGRWRYAVTVTWYEHERYGNDYGTHYDELMPMHNFTQAQAIRKCIAEIDSCAVVMAQRISDSVLERIRLSNEGPIPF